MKPAVTLGAFGVVLAAALGVGAAVGSAAGPIETGGDAHHAEATAEPVATKRPTRGLEIAQDDLRLEADDRVLDGRPFGYRIVGDEGVAVTDFVEQHERKMHLIIASRDLSTFHHVHPRMDVSGHWQVQLPALSPGAYRAFADFAAVGHEPMTLGVDLTVPGLVAAPEELAVSRTDEVDGYHVTLDGALEAGADSRLTVTVERNGEVIVTEPYLGAAGHMVTLRDGDLAYLHVHPLTPERIGPVPFAVDVPSASTYAVFFDFLHEGEVRTARFVLEAASASTGGPTAETPTHDDEGH